MAFFDVLLLIIIVGFVLFGLWFGLIHTLGSLVGTVLGAILASIYYEPISSWLISSTGWSENFVKVVVFVLLFFIINRLIGFLFYLIEKFTGIVTWLPFVKSFNRLLGAVLGLVEGLIAIGLVLYFIERFPFSETITEKIADSVIAPYAQAVANVVVPLIPQAAQFIEQATEVVK